MGVLSCAGHFKVKVFADLDAYADLDVYAADVDDEAASSCGRGTPSVWPGSPPP